MFKCAGVAGLLNASSQDFKYALIGGGIGLFLSLLFILSKICMIRKQAEINFPESSVRRPSEPQSVILNQLSQSAGSGIQ
ncbi:uncharacterized protein LOC129377540 isoform X2 [Poeciliopsis prolifica]|uniref:uncharacterized protein LOC129377540 isoform X2 n=1 Tax=Poeciliopsis prolifica TaxID=188132 RepID=UPI00241414B2|nr:uncharacterized protein LOC129377540 isoform X2 [Poeciliopsis prolifica]